MIQFISKPVGWAPPTLTDVLIWEKADSSELKVLDIQPVSCSTKEHGAEATA
jgi:hypothetical protein